MSRVGIIDGHNLAWRNMLVGGRDPMMNSAGEETTVIFGFLKSLERYANSMDLLLTDIVITWDEGKDIEKMNMLPTYKGNREKRKSIRPGETAEETLESFHIQKEILQKKVLPSLGVPQLSVKGIEADDIIYWLVRTYSGEVDFTVISSDKDLLQCVSYATVYRPIASPEVYEKGSSFKSRLGVRKNQFVLFRAIVGDTSDNIPGIRGCGEKTAIRLLADNKSFTKPLSIIQLEEEFRSGYRGLSSLSDSGTAHQFIISYKMISLNYWYHKRKDVIKKKLRLKRVLTGGSKFINIDKFNKLMLYYKISTLFKKAPFISQFKRFAKQRTKWRKYV